eukprot:NODE_5549_length_999_cov_37.860731_g4976_i0.p1 GENE.NODE_5549_length_999_cov_37.860731_g4976_i0~~NODE_5549_length_999_cov_37.860731_g4976_i0.p1  ORF type:complete len:322 (+),score=48.84 NODE_5549_length_999_cov_37.860731_g4976_i0:61-966(+)
MTYLSIKEGFDNPVALSTWGTPTKRQYSDVYNNFSTSIIDSPAYSNSSAFGLNSFQTLPSYYKKPLTIRDDSFINYSYPRTYDFGHRIQKYYPLDDSWTIRPIVYEGSMETDIHRKREYVMPPQTTSYTNVPTIRADDYSRNTFVPTTTVQSSYVAPSYSSLASALSEKTISYLENPVKTPTLTTYPKVADKLFDNKAFSDTASTISASSLRSSRSRLSFQPKEPFRVSSSPTKSYGNYSTSSSISDLGNRRYTRTGKVVPKTQTISQDVSDRVTITRDASQGFTKDVYCKAKLYRPAPIK